MKLFEKMLHMNCANPWFSQGTLKAFQSLSSLLKKSIWVSQSLSSLLTQKTSKKMKQKPRSSTSTQRNENVKERKIWVHSYF